MDPAAAAARRCPDVLVCVDAAGTISWASPSAATVLGIDPEARVGTVGFDLLHPDDVAYAAGMLAEAIAEPGRHAPPIVRVHGPGGTWVAVEIAVANDDEGGLVCSLRPTADRGLLPARRNTLDRLLHTTAARCAGAVGAGLGDAIDDALGRLAMAHGAAACLLVAVDHVREVVLPRRAWQAATDEPLLAAQALAALPWDPWAPPAAGYVELHGDVARRALLVPGAEAVALVDVPITEDGLAVGFVRLRFASERAVVGWDVGNVEVVSALATLLHRADERRRAEAALERRATSDPLTSLANRHRLQDALVEALHEGRSDACLLYCDLDGFKAVNDHLGHDGGDAVLVEVARAIEGAVRQQDLVARIGGDEFVVLCRRLGASDPATVAERVRAAVRAVDTGGAPSLDVSVGVVRAAPDDTAASLLRAADAAMYRAKRARVVA